MKKLLIILALIPVLSFGQIDTTLFISGDSLELDSTYYSSGMLSIDFTIWEPPDSVNLYFQDWDTTYRVKNDWKTQSITMSLIFIYADECYHDSTLHLSNYWKSLGEGCFISAQDSTWSRKEPTFPGFIEWLNKK